MITPDSLSRWTRTLTWWLAGLQGDALDDAVADGRLGVA